MVTLASVFSVPVALLLWLVIHNAHEYTYADLAQLGCWFTNALYIVTNAQIIFIKKNQITEKTTLSKEKMVK